MLFLSFSSSFKVVLFLAVSLAPSFTSCIRTWISHYRFYIFLSHSPHIQRWRIGSVAFSVDEKLLPDIFDFQLGVIIRQGEPLRRIGGLQNHRSCRAKKKKTQKRNFTCELPDQRHNMMSFQACVNQHSQLLMMVSSFTKTLN